MQRCLARFAVLWVLVLAQCVSVAIGPARLVLCREASGSAHIEAGVRGCCDMGRVAVGVDQDRVPADGCAGDGCRDEIVTEPRVSHARAPAGAATRDLGAIAAPRLAGVLTPAPEPPAASRRASEADGATRQPRFAVRSVALRL